MKRSRIAILVMLLLVTMVVSACGAEATATTGAVAPTATTAAAMAQPTATTAAAMTEATATTGTTAGAADVPAATIRVGSWESGDAIKLWDTIIKGFNAQYPQIKVSFEPVPDNYGTKLLTQIAAGDAPDVFQVGDGDVRMFVERGGAADLTEYMAGKGSLPGLDANIFYPSLAETGKVDGKSYFLTKDYSPLVIFYNKDIFDKAGVAYPKDGWTWTEFRDTAKKLTSGSGATATYGAALPGNWSRAIEALVFANGGDYTSPDGTKVEGFLNSPATIEALQFYVDMYTKDKSAPSPADMSTTFNGVDLFNTGKVAMNFTGRWPLADYQKNPNLKFGVVGLPQWKQRANAVCWAGLGLYKGSKNPDQAWLFLRYAGGADGQKVFASNALPSVPAVADELKLATNEYTGPVLNEVQYLKPLADMRTRWYNDTAAKFLGEAMDKLLAEGGDVTAAINDAATKAQAEYDTLSTQQ